MELDAAVASATGAPPEFSEVLKSEADEPVRHNSLPSKVPDTDSTFGHPSEALSIPPSSVWEVDGQHPAELLDLNQHDDHLTNVGVDHAAETEAKPSDSQVHKPTGSALQDDSKLVNDRELDNHGTSLLQQEPNDRSKGPTVAGNLAGATGDNDIDASAHALPLDHRLIRSLYYEDEEDEEEEGDEVDGEGEDDDGGEDDDDKGPFDSKDRWTHKATETLIELWAEQRLKAEKPYMKSADWLEIVVALNSAVDAPPWSERQVKDKLFYMKKKFKQNRKKRLAGKKNSWAYYDRMAAVFEVDKQWSTRAKPDKGTALTKKTKREYKKRQVSIAPAANEHAHAELPSLPSLPSLPGLPGLPGGGGTSGTDGLLASYRNIAMRDFVMSGDRVAGGNFPQDRHLPTFNTPPYAAHPMLSTALPNFMGLHPNAQPGITVLPGLPNLQGMLPNLANTLGRLVASSNSALAGLIPAASPVLTFEETFEIEYFISQLQNSPPPGKDPISEADRLKLLDMVEAGHKGVVVAWRVAKEAVAKNPSRDLLLEFWIGVSRQLSARKRTWTEMGVPAISDQAPSGVARPSIGF